MQLSLGKATLLICIGVLLAAILTEVAFRLFLSNKILRPVIPPEIGRFDERLGWSLKPLSYGVSNRTGYDIEYRINSKGLRDDETPYEKPEGIFRIVLLGDSLTFGYGVPIDKHFSRLLEGYLTNGEVINMGVGGYGVDQELLFLRSEGFRYHPDLVLAYVAFYGNHRHMHTERFGKKKPRFVLMGGDLMLTNSPVVDSLSQVKSKFREIHGWFVSNSKTYEVVYYKGLRGLINQNRQGVLNQREDEQNAQKEEFRRELYELGEVIINAMHEDSSKHGATFVLVSQMPELHQAMLKRHILSLDVSGPLSNDKFSLSVDKHINESGNGVLAWEIAKFLKAKGLIPSKHLKEEKQ
jgi:hypothetical protein